MYLPWTTAAATIIWWYMFHRKNVIESMQANWLTSNLMWILHLQSARSVVSFLCVRMCLQKQAIHLVFISLDLGQYSRVTFVKGLKSEFILPRLQRLPRPFQRPAISTFDCIEMFLRSACDDHVTLVYSAASWECESVTARIGRRRMWDKPSNVNGSPQLPSISMYFK